LKVALIGGGGFRTPLTYAALLDLAGSIPIDQLSLHDTDDGRLQHIEQVLSGIDQERGRALRRESTTDLEVAVDGADVVLCAIRAGGLAGRVIDERVPLALGVVGQETTGPGGIGFALRTVPVLLAIAAVVARRAPDAWFINFTNPVGLVTEALQSVLGRRAIGVCDTPVGLCRRVASALHMAPGDLWFEYFGLNHLGWLSAARDATRDRLPELLADDAALGSFEEGRLFDPHWLRSLGLIPNEYLVYYYATDRIVGAITERGFGRAEYLLEQQNRFYEHPLSTPLEAVRRWRAATAERDRTYLAESRSDDESEIAFPVAEGDGQGYAAVAAALIRGLHANERSVMILNTDNRRAISGLDSRAVVEVPCVVTSAGVAPLAVNDVPPHAAALMATIKEVERTTIDAALTGSSALALKALALHPLVPSFEVAERIFAGYLAQQPLLRSKFV
jgi:6-phospho-beta-glucosidase